MATLRPTPNSFVTLYNIDNPPTTSGYLTDTECGIQKDFCYPIYDEKDLAFQFHVASAIPIVEADVDIFIPTDDLPIAVTGATIEIDTNGTYQGNPVYTIYLNFNGSTLTEGLADGDCFELYITVGSLQFMSNQCFKKINDKCLTSQLVYVNTSNAFGFNYFSYGTFPLISVSNNIIRLPIYFKEPLIDMDGVVYDRSNGTQELLSARLMKRYKGIVDYVPEEVHQKLVIALNHDGVYWKVEDFDQFQSVFRTREYNNNFPEVMQNVNIWSADFIIFVTPFDNFNSNC